MTAIGLVYVLPSSRRRRPARTIPPQTYAHIANVLEYDVEVAGPASRDEPSPDLACAHGLRWFDMS